MGGKKRALNGSRDEDDEQYEKKQKGTSYNLSGLSNEELEKRVVDLEKEAKKCSLDLQAKKREKGGCTLGCNDVRALGTKLYKAEYLRAEVQRELQRRMMNPMHIVETAGKVDKPRAGSSDAGSRATTTQEPPSLFQQQFAQVAGLAPMQSTGPAGMGIDGLPAVPPAFQMASGFSVGTHPAASSHGFQGLPPAFLASPAANGMQTVPAFGLQASPATMQTAMPPAMSAGCSTAPSPGAPLTADQQAAAERRARTLALISRKPAPTPGAPTAGHPGHNVPAAFR